ncbi:MAG TPA: hypothetical protein DCE41_33570 [Cytophagales bacterium]|nr:hypothetical protein [Cytophagales bacterium]
MKSFILTLLLVLTATVTTWAQTDENVSNISETIEYLSEKHQVTLCDVRAPSSTPQGLLLTNAEFRVEVGLLVVTVEMRNETVDYFFNLNKLSYVYYRHDRLNFYFD